MSILLDSLRKSETQRKFGDTPSIHSTQQYGSNVPLPKQWVAVSMIILAASVVTWFGWQQYAGPGGGLSSSQASGVELAVSEPEESAPPTTEAPPEPGPSGADAGTPVERLSQAAEPEASKPEVTEPATSGDAVPSSPMDRIAGFVAEDESELEEAGLDGQEMASNMEDQVAEESQPGPDAETEFAEVAAAAPERRARVEPPDSEPLTYWQLPQSLRGDMPEFKITVLVYADTPEDRFILINGERLKEQEELETGVVLQEIRRDGAVFSYRHYRFLVKS